MSDTTGLQVDEQQFTPNKVGWDAEKNELVILFDAGPFDGVMRVPLDALEYCGFSRNSRETRLPVDQPSQPLAAGVTTRVATPYELENGWIKHDGNGCPVAAGTRIQVRRHRHNGFVETFASGGDGVDWRFDPASPAPGDVTHWRLDPSCQQEQPLAAGDWEGDSVKLQLEYEFLPSGDMVIVDRLNPPTPPAPAEQEDAADLAAIEAAKVEGVYVPLDEAMKDADKTSYTCTCAICKQQFQTPHKRSVYCGCTHPDAEKAAVDAPSKIVNALQSFSDKLASGEPIAATRVERHDTPDGPMHTRMNTQLLKRAMEIQGIASQVPAPDEAEIEAASPKLQLREGGWYRRRDGKVAGPAVQRDETYRQRWLVDGESYWDNGTWNMQHFETSYDLIAEVPAPSWQPHDGGQ